MAANPEDTNSKSLLDNNFSEIFKAIDEQNIEVFKKLISNLDKNQKYNDEYGVDSTFLHYAAHAGFLPAVKILLGKGFEINHQNSNGITPLHMACLKTNLEMVQLLIKEGSSPYVKDTLGRSPFMYAVETSNPVITKYFLDEHIGNTNEKDSIEISALCYAIKNKGNQYQNNLKENLEVIQLLVENGANINTDTGTELPISVACEYANTGAFQYLIEKKADLSTALRASLIYPQLECLKIVLPLIEDTIWHIDSPLDNNGNTAAHLAVIAGDLEMLKYLRTKAADFHIYNKETHDILLTAVKHGKIQILSYLLESKYSFLTVGDNLSPIHCAAQYNQVSVLEFLLQNNLGSLEDVYRNLTPLLMAGGYGNLDMVNFILKLNPNRINDVDEHDNNLWLIAAKFGRLELIQNLFYNSLYTEQFFSYKNRMGMNVFHVALSFDQPEVLRLLIVLACNIYNTWLNPTKNKLYNPLDLAGESCQKILKAAYDLDRMVKWKFSEDTHIDFNLAELIQQGASSTQTDGNGDTPLHRAAGLNNVFVFKILLEDYFLNRKGNISGFKLLYNKLKQNPIQIAKNRNHRTLAIYPYFYALRTLIQNNDLQEANKVSVELLTEMFNLTSDLSSEVSNSWNSIHIDFHFECWSFIRNTPNIIDQAQFENFIKHFSKSLFDSLNEYASKFVQAHEKPKVYLMIGKRLNTLALNEETVKALNLVLQKSTELKKSNSYLALIFPLEKEAHAILAELYVTGRINPVNNTARSEAEVLATTLGTLDEDENSNKSKNNSEVDNIYMGLLHYLQAGKNPEIVKERILWTNRFRGKTLGNMTLGDPYNPTDLMNILQDANRREKELEKDNNRMEDENNTLKKNIAEKDSALQVKQMELEKMSEKNAMLQENFQTTSEKFKLEIARIEGELSVFERYFGKNLPKLNGDANATNKDQQAITNNNQQTIMNNNNQNNTIEKASNTNTDPNLTPAYNSTSNGHGVKRTHSQMMGDNNNDQDNHDFPNKR